MTFWTYFCCASAPWYNSSIKQRLRSWSLTWLSCARPQMRSDLSFSINNRSLWCPTRVDSWEWPWDFWPFAAVCWVTLANLLSASSATVFTSHLWSPSRATIACKLPSATFGLHSSMLKSPTALTRSKFAFWRAKKSISTFMGQMTQESVIACTI